MNHNLSPERKLRFLAIYMNEFIDKWPNKIKPFDSWLQGTLDKRVNKGKHEMNQRHRNICRYCRREFDVYTEKTKDHVVPVSRGGYDKKENRVPCCKDCNQWKNDKTPQQWLDQLKQLVKKEKKIKPPYDKNMIARMIHSLKEVIAEVKNNIGKASTYKL